MSRARDDSVVSCAINNFFVSFVNYVDQPRTITQLLQPTVHLYYTNRTRLNSEKMEIDRK